MKKILLIDDDRDLSFLMQKTLAKQGYDAFVCHDALMGIKEALLKRPDLIFMDVMMPKMTGDEAVRKLQAYPELKDIPIVFLTGLLVASSDPAADPTIKVAGMKYRVIGKPFEIEELLKVAQSILG